MGSLAGYPPRREGLDHRRQFRDLARLFKHLAHIINDAHGGGGIGFEPADKRRDGVARPTDQQIIQGGGHHQAGVRRSRRRGAGEVFRRLALAPTFNIELKDIGGTQPPEADFHIGANQRSPERQSRESALIEALARRHKS